MLRLIYTFIFAIGLFGLAHQYPDMHPYYIALQKQSQTVFHFTHKASNSFFSWKAYPLFSFPIIAALFYSLTAFILIARGQSILISLGCLSALLCFFGFDVTIAATVFAGCLFSTALQKFYGTHAVFAPFLLFAFSCTAAVSAMQLAPLAALFAFIFFILEDQEFECSNNRLRPLIIFLAPIFLCIVMASEPIFPDIPFEVQRIPLATAYGQTYVIDREFIRFFWGAISPFFFLLMLGALLFRSYLRLPIKLAGLGLALTLFLLIDTRAPEELSQEAPLLALSRLLPDLYFFPLAPYCFALLLLFIALAFKPKHLLPGMTVTLCTLSLIPLQYMVTASEQRLPLTIASTPALSAQCKSSPIAASPSLGTLKKYNLGFLCSQRPITRFVLTEKNASVQTSTPSKPRRNIRILDAKLDTRWSTKLPQKGDEWLEFNLLQPMSVTGVELLTGKWRHDNPANLTVEVSKSCEEGGYTRVYSEKSGRQRVHLSADGYPFVKTDASFAAVWPSVADVGCIRIQQSGSADHHWSVARVELLLADSN